MNMRREI